jgi:hypothetical protein
VLHYLYALVDSRRARKMTLAGSAPGGLPGGIAAAVAILGLVAVLAWASYRYGPTITRATGMAMWWTAWACGSEGAFGYMSVLLALGTSLWAGGTIWYARRRGHWPSPVSARLLGRRSTGRRG